MPPPCMFLVAFLVCAWVLVPTTGQAQFGVCHLLQCPTFVIKTQNQVYEERQYSKQMWVETTGDPKNMDKSRLEMFRKLLVYMTGGNVEKKSMNISLPFLTKVVRPLGAATTSNISMYIFLPRDAQKAPPAPTDPTVRIVSTPVSGAYVRAFGGWTSRDIVKNIRYGVMRAVANPRLYDDTHFYLATYSGPFQTQNRYNELWVVKTDLPDTQPLS